MFGRWLNSRSAQGIAGIDNSREIAPQLKSWRGFLMPGSIRAGRAINTEKALRVLLQNVAGLCNNYRVVKRLLIERETMGTRNLTAVIKNGQPVIAQYGQWDGYPEGQGATVYEFIKNGGVAKLEANLDKAYWADEAELKEIYSKYQTEDGWMTMEQGQALTEAYPSLSRDTCAGILEVVANATERVPLVNEMAFLQDTLFCEWAYVFDLDTYTLKVYAGTEEPRVEFHNIPSTFEEFVKRCYDSSESRV